MRAWRRQHPDATAAHVEAKAAHFDACQALTHATNQEALGMMPSRIVEAVRRREIAARAALSDVEAQVLANTGVNSDASSSSVTTSTQAAVVIDVGPDATTSLS